jgi:crotonobetainyl-CoA:carnitine CoA-transferase CaiB-like acyl-CoA transferase
MSSVLMGPLATCLMSDLGADVVKVEPPAGDALRYVGYPAEKGMGPLYQHVNRGKSLVIADVATAEGRNIVADLCRTADVFSTNVRPAALARAGLGYDQLAALNPRLVYVSMVGFASGGPKSGLPAYDDLMQAESGIAWALGETDQRNNDHHNNDHRAGGDGEPRYVPYNVCDRTVGIYAFGCINAALLSRERTGVGQFVEVPMFETMASLVMGEHLNGQSFTPPTGPTGYQRLMTKSRRPYRTSDGWISALVYTAKNWKAFCAVVGAEGRPDGGIEAEQAFLAEHFALRSTADWQRILTDLDVPVAQVNSFDNLLTNDQLDAVGFWQDIDGVRTPGVPSTWSATPPGPLRPAPRMP